jgi:preprotein translocase subunit SecD
MPTTELHQRLNNAAGNRSYRHLAELTSTNAESVRRYMQGQPPSVEFLSAFCDSLAVNGEWVLTGRGPMRTADLRKAALGEAEASELLAAMAQTIETLIDRVDRVELLVQMLEVRVRATPIAMNLKEFPTHDQDTRTAGNVDRVRAVADALPKRSPPTGR